MIIDTPSSSAISYQDLKLNDRVRRVNSDYEFIGTVVSIFTKTSGVIRYVVEDDRGVLFIWNRNNMEKI